MIATLTDQEQAVDTGPSSTCRTRVVDPLCIGGWDEQVLMFPEATVFHSAGWARVLREAYGYAPLYLTAVRGHELVGVLPLMEVNSRLTGRRGVALPFSDFCPPLAADPAAARALVQNARELATDRRWKYVEFRGVGESTTEKRGNGGMMEGWKNGSSASHHLTPVLHHSVDLTPAPAALFGSFSSSTRRAIRKSERSGLEIGVDSALGSVREFYSLHALTRRRHGLPPQPFAFFKHLHREVLSQGGGFVVTARYGRRPIAASIFLRFGRHALYKYGAADLRFQDLRAANRVMWEGIQACARQGAALLSLGRTDCGNQGLRRFKRGWGASEQILLDRRIHVQTGQTLPAGNALYGWRNQIFRRLPLAANRVIGALLYPHLG